jgi:hypothetical protein
MSRIKDSFLAEVALVKGGLLAVQSPNFCMSGGAAGHVAKVQVQHLIFTVW